MNEFMKPTYEYQNEDATKLPMRMIADGMRSAWQTLKYWILASVVLGVLLTYRTQLQSRWVLQEQARSYIEDPKSLCNNAQLRIKVGPTFDRCQEAENVLASFAPFEAFIQTLQAWGLCSGSSCMVFSVNFFNALHWIFPIVAVLFGLFILSGGVKLLLFLYNWDKQQKGMPVTLHDTIAKQNAGYTKFAAKHD